MKYLITIVGTDIDSETLNQRIKQWMSNGRVKNLRADGHDGHTFMVTLSSDADSDRNALIRALKLANLSGTISNSNGILIKEF